LKATKVLVIDDDVNSRLMAEYCLVQLNCNCDVAASGEDGLSNISKNHYDMIVLDWNMPQMNGRQTLEFAEKLLHQLGRMQKCSVVVYSSLPMSHLNIPSGYHYNVKGYISKNISPHKQMLGFRKYVSWANKEMKEAV